MAKDVTLEDIAIQVCIDFGRNASHRDIGLALAHYGFADPDNELADIVSEMCANANIRVKLAYVS